MKDIRLKRIAITGPESTGKSDLAIQLARHYKTTYVPEFARDYIAEIDREYVQDDILLIAQNQLKQEHEAAKTAREFLFCDTELIVTRIWSLHKYGSCHPWIDEQIMKSEYDLYLLCDIDLPWEYDKQREHPHLRKFFFTWYKQELEKNGFPYIVVSGCGNARLQNVIDALENYFID